MPRSNATLIFLHLPRTGGTTLEGVIKWEYRLHADRIIQLNRQEPVDQFLSRLRQMSRPPIVVMGHLPYGIDKHLQGETTYVTILRRPVERVLSEYRWIIRDGPHPLHERFAGRGSEGLDEYVSATDLKTYLDNAQVRFLARVPPQDDVSRRDLETAKRNLERCVVAGVTERFDETFLLMRKELGWRTPLYVTRNESPAPTLRIKVSDRMVEQISERNRLDTELHQFANGLLDRAIRRQGPAFQRDLALFKALHRPANAVGRRAQGLIRAFARSRLARGVDTRH